MAKDRTPGNRGKDGPAPGGSAAGKGASATRSGAGGRGRTRPPTQVVTQPRRPWGLIAASIAVVLFAVAAIGYAVFKANESEANEITDPDEIAGIQSFDDYEESQSHVTDPVDYAQSPPVGGPHAPPPDWADCTGTVYDVDIRHENAVHSLEHGAVWITYNPDEVSGADVQALEALVDRSGRMLSPYEGQDSPISIQSWGHQLKVESATDPRLKQYADFFTYNAEYFPEPGASCENPTFIASPLLESADGQAPADGADPSAPATGATEPSESAEAPSTESE